MTNNYFYIETIYNLIRINIISLLKYTFLSPVIIFIAAWPCTEYFPGIIAHFIIALSASIFFSTSTYFFLSQNTNLYIENLLITFQDLAKKGTKYAFIFISLITIFNGPRHDYKSYVKQWFTIINGNDPWIGTDNAYGPIHNLFSIFATLNPILPKIIFVSIFFYSFYKLTFSKYQLIGGNNDISNKIIFLVMSMSPLVIIIVPLYSLNDALVCGLMTYALFINYSLNGSKKSDLITGIIFAFAGMVKIYPFIVALPFLIRGFKIKFHFLKSLSLTTFAITCASYILWGNSIFKPLLFASGRESAHFSIFNFLQSSFDLDLDKYSSLLVVISIFISFFIIQILKIDLLPSTIIIFLPVVTFYKVAHIQFFLFFIPITPILVRYFKEYCITKYKMLIFSYVLWLSFLNFYVSFQHLTCGMYFGAAAEFRDHLAPLIFYPITVNLIFQFFKVISKNPNAFSTQKI